MTTEAFLRAKRANDRVGLIIVVMFIVWIPIYLWVVRPILNEWLAQYVSGYPAMFHLVPTLGLPLFIGWLLAKRYPAPKQPNTTI